MSTYGDYHQNYYERNRDKLREKHCWINMLHRCNNPNHKQFKDYGGRGITVCERWSGKEGFKNFQEDMGPRPKDYTIERIDNDKGYSPDNCKWASRLEQSKNRRNSNIVHWKGRDWKAADLANHVGLTPGGVAYRLRKGYPLEGKIPATQRKTAFIVFNGEQRTVKEVAKELGWSYHRVYYWGKYHNGKLDWLVT